MEIQKCSKDVYEIVVNANIFVLEHKGKGIVILSLKRKSEKEILSYGKFSFSKITRYHKKKKDSFKEFLEILPVAFRRKIYDLAK